MNRLSLSVVCLSLGTTLWQVNTYAQPNVTPTTSTSAPTFSVAELEQFLGGRTTLSLDLKEATLEQLAAALSQSSGQKIDPFATSTETHYGSDGKPIPTPPPLFSFSADKTPFWPALRQAQLAARRAANTALPGTAFPGTLAASVPNVKIFRVGSPLSSNAVPNSLGLNKSASGWYLQTDNSLADGRAVAAWPFLLIANDLKRNQNGSLNEDGMNEPVDAANPLDLAALLNPQALTPKMEVKTDDAEHWSDRLTLSGKLLIEPKLNPLRLRYEILEALDDKGNDLHFGGETAIQLQDLAAPSWISRPAALVMASGGNAVGGNSVGVNAVGSSAAALNVVPNPYAPSSRYSQPLQISLRSKPGMGQRLVRLRGVLHFSVVSRSQHWETTQLDKPIDGTVFQNGGEFKVQFKGLEKTAGGWSAGFAAQSRGPHLAAFFGNSIGSHFTMNTAGSRQPTLVRVVSASIGGSVDDSLGFPSALDFRGVPQMKLVDENGQIFQMTNGLSSSAMTHTVPGAAPVVISPGESPLPPDLAQNWSFDESRAFVFSPSPGFPDAPGVGAAMGRPVKLVLDLPLERREVSVPFEFTNLPLPPS